MTKQIPVFIEKLQVMGTIKVSGQQLLKKSIFKNTNMEAGAGVRQAGPGCWGEKIKKQPSDRPDGVRQLGGEA